jgi:hypothetical protein
MTVAMHYLRLYILTVRERDVFSNSLDCFQKTNVYLVNETGSQKVCEKYPVYGGI